ncbi:hypothetical protein FB451DRAFT_1395353 [Mycena latifolia]|nr:hypothetical protein FB451DRAFT_1395353 [Mycena latifolia]
MSSWLVLVLPFLLGGLHTACAADLDVLPQETIVPQCSTLTALWAQPPPIHLHVQPDDSITIVNLVDLGVQNNSFTTFEVALPIGQNFSFAYNTIAQPFTVFQSSVMQVGPGTTDCMPAQADPIVPDFNSSPSLSASVPSSATSASSVTSASNFVPTPTKSTSAAVVPDSAASTSSSRPPLPAGTVIGVVCAIAGAVLLGLVLLWNSHRRSMKRLAELHSDVERSAPRAAAPRFLAPILGRRRSGPISPYNESAPPPPRSPTKSMLVRESQTSSSAGSREIINIPISAMVSPQDPPKIHGRQLVLHSPPATPTTPVVHTDGGVRIRHPEELPPLYHDYNTR